MMYNIIMGMTTQKSISLRDDQVEWIDENHLNLSRFVQDKLDEQMNDE